MDEDSGLPHLDDLTTTKTVYVVVAILDEDGKLELHPYGTDDLDISMASVLVCAAKLASDDDVASGALN